MKFEWKIKDWRKWLVIGIAAFIGAYIDNRLHPLRPDGFLSPAEARSFITQLGGIIGTALGAFALGGLFAIPFKGKTGAVVGVIVVAAVWGLVFLGHSVDR